MRFQMFDGAVVDTDSARRMWKARPRKEPQEITQALYRSRRGRYYIVSTSDTLIGFTGHAEWVSPMEATRWALLHGHDDTLGELEQYKDKILE